MLETYRGVVYPHQLDHMGHMNVQWYTSKFDEATWHLFSSVGLTNEYMVKNSCGMAALEQKTTYEAELMPGDLVCVKSEVLEVKNKTLRFKHYMYNTETQALCATTELLAVHLDRIKRKGVKLPEFVSQSVLLQEA
ncbi:thioesterase family protein [Marinobacter sp. M216]|uniref:Thioesterase family protein n=1 Tax=Marinobacter albus TaxID=3030833 RepID=A0ABT7HC61_9GAMM|nr:thioesterase family protein [Marinobacter sp. M216]MDK9557898.1 thioesterase family protein [Marinobacter sp. M216]